MTTNDTRTESNCNIKLKSRITLYSTHPNRYMSWGKINLKIWNVRKMIQQNNTVLIADRTVLIDYIYMSKQHN